MRLPRLIPVAAACLSMACAAAIPAMATGPLPAASDVGRTVLAGTAPTWAQRTAPTVSRGATSAIVLLKPSATDAERRDVTGWLRSQGIHVDRDRASIHAMSVSGPRAALAHAFDTTFVRQRVSGRTAVVPARALSVPSGLNAVQSVAGLVDTDAAVPTTVAAPQTSDDCAAYWGQKLSADWPASVKVDHRSNALCGYGPQRLRAIHELPQDATGQGATIAMVAAFDDDSVEANTNTYSAASKMQGFRPGQYTHHAPQDPDTSRCGGPSAWTTEQHLDVQAAHAIAPDANIEYWGAGSCSTQSLYSRILDAAEAPSAPDVISLSFGADEDLDTAADRTLLNRVLVEAASRGISVFASTGNDGDNSLAGDHAEGPGVNSPASSPYVTAVGGTSTGLDADDHIAVEAGWETQTRFAHNGAIIPPGFIYGAGGGESKYYPRPSWQRSLSASGTGRLMPDVSSLADPNTGFTIYSPVDGKPSYEAHGGTSLATPMVASTVAVAKARSHRRIGLASPAFYALAGTPALRDVTPASAATWYRRSKDTGQLWLETLYLWDTKPQTLQSGAGWDEVTGLGVPTGSAFLERFGAQR